MVARRVEEEKEEVSRDAFKNENPHPVGGGNVCISIEK